MCARRATTHLPRARARARLRCNSSFSTAHASPCAVRRRHVSHLKGTFWAHPCPLTRSPPFVALGKDAGRPACFADGSTDDRGAPKGIRNLTCGFRKGSTGPSKCRIVAGQVPFPVSHRSVRSPPASGGFRAVLAHKAREWHAPAQSGRSLQPGHGF